MEKSKETPVKVERTRKPVIDTSIPKPTIRSDTETINIYMDLLRKTPDMPLFTDMFEVTAWLDKIYRPFLQAVRHEVPK